MIRRAVVLMNLGGPDSPQAVKPFLRNLFSDRAIIDLPTILRLPLAALIAARRARVAAEIYEYLGGGSPLLPNTEAQARALESALGGETRCFIAMRYWHPLTGEAVRAVKAWRPDEVVLLPLYPQYSTTTTGSSITAWRNEAGRLGFGCPTRIVRSYPTAPGFISGLANQVEKALSIEPEARLLLSAHGLPLKIVRAGDPYPDEIALTAEALVKALRRPDIAWRVCYQSRVGPLAWLGPSVEDELARAAQDRVPVIVAPISFVSEHSETLVELDRDYRRIAERLGVPGYIRASTVGTEPKFIAALAELARGEAVPDEASRLLA